MTSWRVPGGNLDKRLKRWLVSALFAGGLPLLPSCSVVEGIDAASRGWHSLTRTTFGPCIVGLFSLSRERDVVYGSLRGDSSMGLRLAIGFVPLRLPFGSHGSSYAKSRCACFDWDFTCI